MKRLFPFLILFGCGGTGASDYGNPPPPAPPDHTVTYPEAAAIVKADCGPCHGVSEPALLPEATFRASPAKTRLLNRSMPPPGNAISDGDRAALIAFLSQ